METRFIEHLKGTLSEIEASGLFKKERVMICPQGAEIVLHNGQKAINMCSNNYLGLSSDSRVIKAAISSLELHGYGMSSVRFICGTQDIHKQLEEKIAWFYGKEDSILYAACFDANGGIFEPLFSEEDAIISDALNHASIIDGIRLCKAQRYRYAHADMEDLELKLKEAKAQRFRLIVTDGVFSMDGDIAPLDRIVALAEQYDALVMVDDSHATGFIGRTGRGAGEYHGVLDKIHILSGTLGKAMGGATGGFVTARGKVVEMLRQRSRPYLFSNSLPPVVVGASLAIFDLIGTTTTLRDKLMNNATYFRLQLSKAGFDLKPGDSAIVALMLYDAVLAQKFASSMLDEGIYVTGFYYPVVPQGQARIRVQLSAAHEKEHLDKALKAFVKIGKKFGVIS